MRQRTTFFHRPQSPVDPTQLRLADATLAGPAIDAARQDRLTLTLDEVPASLARLLEDGVQELHVRWAAPQAGAEAVSPLLSRLSPGLHIFYTPEKGVSAEKRDAICSLLRNIFGQSLDCRSISSSFVDLGDARLRHSAALQFYAPLESLAAFSDYVKAEWCPPASADPSADGSFCAVRADQLDGASAVDLSYDAGSRTLKVTTQWPLAEWPVFVTSQPGARTEVGILGADAPPTLGPYEIGMAGHVAVLGQDDRPSPVMFAFPSRHRQAPRGASFSAAFLQPTGLHPTLQLRVAAGIGTPPPRTGDDGTSFSCRLHAYLTLPRHIFADKYQLGDDLFLASKNLTALHHITQPVDLEAPDYAVSVWGSAALIELAPPPSARSGQEEEEKQKQEWTAEIPLHLRYLHPADGGYCSVDVPYPVVFWACPADKDTQFSTNPFDRVHLGYDGLFDEHTEFWHLKPDPHLGSPSSPSSEAAAASRLVNTIRAPVLDSAKAQWVNVGTSAAILLGFSWVLWKLLSVYLRTGYGRATAPQSIARTAKKTQ